MSTAVSIFQEGNGNNHDETSSIDTDDDHDITTEINETHDGVLGKDQNSNTANTDNVHSDKIHISISRKKISFCLQLIGWVLLLYCVVCCTYVLSIISEHRFCSCDSSVNIAEKMTPNTGSPTNNPSASPTMNPSISPSISQASKLSASPTFNPSMSPTEYYQRYDHFVGDYKLSVQNESHGAWLLCDGSTLVSDDYPRLTDLLRARFGSFNSSLPSVLTDGEEIGLVAYFVGECPSGWQSYTDLSGRFALASSGSEYTVNSMGGAATHTLSDAEMPLHNHIVGGYDIGTVSVGTSGADTPSRNVENYPSLTAKTTSYRGSSASHNNMPPYLVLNACQKTKAYRGNMFIYSG